MSSALWCVRKGRAAAPPASVWRTGVSTSTKPRPLRKVRVSRSEEHTSELQSQSNIVCRLLLEKINPTPPIWRIQLLTKFLHSANIDIIIDESAAQSLCRDALRFANQLPPAFLCYLLHHPLHRV